MGRLLIAQELAELSLSRFIVCKKDSWQGLSKRQLNEEVVELGYLVVSRSIEEVITMYQKHFRPLAPYDPPATPDVAPAPTSGHHPESRDQQARLSKRAINTLKKNKVSTVREFLALDETDIRMLSTTHTKTVVRLIHLQRLLRHDAEAMDDEESIIQAANRILNSPAAQGKTGIEIAVDIVSPIVKDDPIPLEVLNELNANTRIALRDHDISTVGQLLGFGKPQIYSLRMDMGVKVVNELLQLHSLFHQHARDPDKSAAAWRQHIDMSPEAWSILRKPLRALCQTSFLEQKRSYDKPAAKLVSELNLDYLDLKALRSVAVFPFDCLEDLYALSFGILAKSGVSETGFTTICELHQPSQHKDYWLDKICDTPIICPEDIGKLPAAQLHVFDVPLDIVDSLNSIGICRLQDASRITERDIIKCHGFSPKSLRIISHLWSLHHYSRKALAEKGEQIHALCTSFEYLWDHFMQLVTRTPREKRIIEGRLGVLDNRKWTLEELGTIEGLSRERVRQIQKRVERRIDSSLNQVTLEKLWDAVKLILDKAGGTSEATELGESLRDYFAWPSSPALKHLLAVCGMNKALTVTEDGEDSVTVNGTHPCTECDMALGHLVQLVVDSRHGLTADEIARALTNRCSLSCALELGQHMIFSRNYVHRLALRTDALVAEKDRLYSRETWALSFGNTSETVDAALLTAGGAVHFLDLTASIRNMGKDISDRNVHACLSSRLETALLWDRGTYIHVEHVAIPWDLVSRIENEIIARLGEGIPLISVNALFLEFETHLQEKGIPTDRALYSCLKMSSHPALTYPRYPYVTPAETGSERPTVVSVAEDFVRRYEEGISSGKIEYFLVSVLGISAQLRHNFLYNIPNIVQIDTGLYLHLDHLDIDPATLWPIEEYVNYVLAHTDQVVVDMIFNDKQSTCKRLGIHTPVMLYSLLQIHYGDQFELPRYPVIARTGITAEIGVFAQIAEYLREAGTPCSTERLAAHFVERLGFKESSIYNVKYHERVAQYAQGAVVHKDSLKWTPRKQGTIETIALTHLKDRERLGKPYGLIERLLASPQLPPMPSHSPWTQILLGELLCCEGGFKLIGNKRNAFVQIPNNHGIDSLQSLVYTLLKNEYDGKAPRIELEIALRGGGILQRSLTPAMLGDGSLVSIDGEIVRIDVAEG